MKTTLGESVPLSKLLKMNGKKIKKSKRRLRYDIDQEKTHKAFCRPKKGDRFHEMYSCWMYVVKVTKKFVYVMMASAPCTFPDDAEIEKLTREKYKIRWRYDPKSREKVPGYSYTLCDRGNKVAGWLKGLFPLPPS